MRWLILLAAATGLSTQQARTAAPSAVNVSGVAAAEGSSLSFARADHTHSLSGTLPEANGGTGAGALTCSAGQVLTSNGTAYSCVNPTGSVAWSGNAETASSPNALTLKGNVAAAAGPAVIIDNVTAQNAGQSVLAVRTGGGVDTFSVKANGDISTSASLVAAAAAIGSLNVANGIIAGDTISNTSGDITTTGSVNTSALASAGALAISAVGAITGSTTSHTTTFTVDTGNANFGISGALNDFTVQNTAAGGGSSFSTSAFTITGPTGFGTAGFVRNTSAGVLSGGNTTEHDFSAFRNTFATPSAAAFSRTKVTNASTLTADSYYTPVVVGVGAGNFVVRLCSDGTTCGAGNIYLTCTNACTAAVGTPAACTVTKAAVSAATTLTWAVGTACATTDPGFNVNAHMTTP